MVFLKVGFEMESIVLFINNEKIWMITMYLMITGKLVKDGIKREEPTTTAIAAGDYEKNFI